MSDVEIAVDNKVEVKVTPAKVGVNLNDIQTAIDTLFPEGTVVELRIPKAKFKGRNLGTISGYYDDHTELAKDILSVASKYTAVYYLLNPCEPSLLSRSVNKSREHAEETTTDAQILRRRWLLLDIDPQRAAGISSSDDEKLLAKAKTAEIYKYLKSQKWPEPLFGDSGNGFHLLYRIDLENTPENTELCKGVLKALAQQFDTDKVKVDKSVFNAARIVKAYGSMARKGEQCDEQRRFHRVSKLAVEHGGGTECVSSEQLSALAGLVPAVEAPKPKTGGLIANKYKQVEYTDAHMRAFLEFYGIEWRSEGLDPDGRYKFVLQKCFFDPSHTNKDAAVFVGPNGLGYFCFHNGCAENHWRQFRDAVEAKFGKRFSFSTLKESTLSDKPVDDEPIDPNDWQGLFHTYEETVSAPPITWSIAGFLQNQVITMVGGLPGHGKTLVGLAMVQSLLTGDKLFDQFDVMEKAERVLYLIPESALSPFVARLKTFRLVEFVGKTLFYRTLSSDEDIAITDPRILAAANGAVVFLDTAIRFMDGNDENSSAEQKKFTKNLFALVKAGARAVIGLHHSPKNTEKLDYMSLENVFRGSGEIGAMLATGWGVRLIDEDTTRLWIQCVKPRDFKPCAPFIVEGFPYLDRDGKFKMIAPAGMTGSLNENKSRRDGSKPSGRPVDPEKKELLPKMLAWLQAGKTKKEIVGLSGKSKRTVDLWLKEATDEQAVATNEDTGTVQ